MTRFKSTTEFAAAQIIDQASQARASRQCFLYTPMTGGVETSNSSAFPPLITVTGGKVELEILLASFEGWTGSLKIGVLYDQGLLDFWVY